MGNDPVPSRRRGPLFIGGVQRSGTHALAHLVSHHSQYAMIPRELVFHAAVGNGGLPDLITDNISLKAFVERMATFWWQRSVSWDPTSTHGLHKTIPDDPVPCRARSLR